ncbi:nucleoside hydrolase [Marisediminicola antarctica]|uniref:Nucleoside hydrolase n=1 Tax=Marisediminicola antarctica TaxID=674079 RepID=A0A7L5AKX7_9MICO|nr:nucleoside hydrolase [Marisediminicola antarctica]QHO69781.1 nucleoside hydrolase [Marisediminicola antarctica]
MARTKLLLDCDPGLDDALALLLAHSDPDLELVAVTTVGGNVDLVSTTRNARVLREYLGFVDVPIAAGAAQPLVRDAENAAHVHGEAGLGTVRLPAATLPASDRHAVDVIIETLRAAPGEVHLVATGPLTNIALALAREPRVVEWAASFVIMGGSFTRGNATVAAEFNIYADPEAAAVVFAAGWQVVMIGLDLTLQAIVTPQVVDRMRHLGPLGVDLVVPLATFWVDPNDADWSGQAVHDVCAVAYIARPELFQSRPARVEVETQGHHTSGMTVVDFTSSAPNAIVPVELDVAGFWDYVHSAWQLTADGHAND